MEPQEHDARQLTMELRGLGGDLGCRLRWALAFSVIIVCQMADRFVTMIIPIQPSHAIGPYPGSSHQCIHIYRGLYLNS